MGRIYLLFLIILVSGNGLSQSKALVFQTDFGLKDGAVAAMKGVAYGVSNDLQMFDLTHEIPPFNIWEGAYRLNQAAPYWPAGTVFVSVIDPGVGSARRSIVLRTKTGHYFVTPDNGTLTLIADNLGVEEVREIDETKNRLKNSLQSYTFHGRDVYAYTGARLASGIIAFEQVGAVVSTDIVRLSYQKPVFSSGKIEGFIEVLDVQYGNIWTNIGRDTFDKLGLAHGDLIHVKIQNNEKIFYEGELVFGKTFADVQVGKVIGYLNSINKFSIGINQGSFAEKFRISTGSDWKVVVSRAGK